MTEQEAIEFSKTEPEVVAKIILKVQRKKEVERNEERGRISKE